LTPDEAARLAQRALRARFPTAGAAFVAGSIVRGEGAPRSDIDLVVLHDHVAASWREAFLFETVPVEAFVHDAETLAWRLEEDRKLGGPALMAMVAEGVLVGPRPDEALAWRVRAQAMLDAGPPPLTSARLDEFRYHITDRVDDLRDQRPAADIMATGVALYASLSELILRSRGAWAAFGKWIPRRLKLLDPELEARFSAAFGALFAQADVRPVIALAEEVLQPLGGFLFAGYRSDAPETARREGPATDERR
jgi:hypothetical protein